MTATATCIGCGHVDRLVCERGGRHWLRLDRNRGAGVCNQCTAYFAAWDPAHAFGPPHLDLVAHLYRQREFSLRAFGPGPRVDGVAAHTLRNMAAAEHPPGLADWIDAALLALDGAWRAGYDPAEIALALATQQTRNELRTWPDWRMAAPDTANQVHKGDLRRSPTKCLPPP